MKARLPHLLAIVAILLLASCKPGKPGGVNYPVYWGSGKGCADKGICAHPPAGNTINANFKLIDSNHLEISFDTAELKSKQAAKYPDFYNQTSYKFDHIWIAPRSLDSALGIKRLIIWPGIKYALKLKGKRYYMMMQLNETSISTTVKYGHGQTCVGKGICSSGAQQNGEIPAIFYYNRESNHLTLQFRLSDVDPTQQPDFMPPAPDPLAPVIYPFEEPWNVPPIIKDGLGIPTPITILPGVPNEVYDVGNGFSCIIFDLKQMNPL